MKTRKLLVGIIASAVLILAAQALPLAVHAAPATATALKIPGEKLLRKLDHLETQQNDESLFISISAYGIPEAAEPEGFKNWKYSRYVNAVIENPHGYSFGLAKLIEFVDQTQYDAKGRWRGFIVTRIVIENELAAH